MLLNYMTVIYRPSIFLVFNMHKENIQKRFIIFDKNKKMLTKTILKEQIEKFPENFSIEELIERLIVIDKIERGKEQSENGEVVSESEINTQIEKWFE